MKRLIPVLLLACQALHAQTPEKLGDMINSEFTEIQPVISPDGKTLYFSRVSHPQNASNKKGSQDVWFSEYLTGTLWTAARRMPNPVNSEEHNVIYSVTPDGNTLLTHWTQKDGDDLSIRGFATMKKQAGGWERPKKLDIPGLDNMNKGYYQYGYLANDGKTLLLAFSEKKNAKESDLYVSFLDKAGKWSRPMSLGSNINTDGDETTPFLAADGQTLYFSSNRPGGLGSNDIWVSHRLDKSWRKWSNPENLGAPINTPEFDAYFTIPASGEWAYFVTTTNGKADVARILFQKIAPDTVAPPTVAQTVDKPAVQTGKPVDNTQGKNSNAVVMIIGKLYDAQTKKVPANARIVFESLVDGRELGTATPDPVTGEYKISLPYGDKYGIRPEVEGYVGKSLNLDLKTLGGGGYLELNDRDLVVTKIAAGAKVDLNNVFFETAKATLQPESFPELNRVVELMNKQKAMTVEIAGHTDSDGTDEANMKLSQDRAASVRNYLISKGIAEVRVVAKGYGESHPVAPNDTPENKQRNRRVEFVIVKN
ncbi:OmpA family protein [Siphonobacter aquaeclarae]|uniref:WD40-like Beta Propeller Repeat n=1 Tax=Siphonobacter aquaeclarae TaxID=563176 RepID=A0A1G9UHV9_9BACT|nr:OmpA family protein [Siphonobacter aquaeclarae]SDM59500.1 WD40-like Beta Propeller Repeat [Siphonobacter aquaeclarae]